MAVEAVVVLRQAVMVVLELVMVLVEQEALVAIVLL